MKIKLRPLLRLKILVSQSFFWNLTAVGNAIIVAGAVFLYRFESVQQDFSLDFIDCLLWSTGTVTTIGYGSYIPHSLPGKITLLVLMISGTLFVWMYMVFLVTGLITPELTNLEKDVHEVEKEIQDLRQDKKK